jgi:hypothetical protein
MIRDKAALEQKDLTRACKPGRREGGEQQYTGRYGSLTTFSTSLANKSDTCRAVWATTNQVADDAEARFRWRVARRGVIAAPSVKCGRSKTVDPPASRTGSPRGVPDRLVTCSTRRV